jgi:hypothetical protein
MRFVAVVLFSLILFACSEAPKGVLIELPGAKNVERSTLRGMDTLQYKLYVRYPARDQIHQIRQHLEKDGWKPLPYIYLFPKNPSSIVQDWTFFNDPPRDPAWVIYEWTADWVDTDGNVVTYTFRYQDPVGKYRGSTFIVGPSKNEMSVTALYTPAGIAKHKQAMLNRQK